MSLSLRCARRRPALLPRRRPRRAQKLDKEDKKWLDEVRPIMLPDEEKTFREPQGQGRPRGVPEDLLGAARSRPRHARQRVPGRVRHRACAEADQQFRVAAAPAPPPTAAASTSCSGKPDEVKPDKTVSGDAPSLRRPESGPTATARAMKFAGRPGPDRVRRELPAPAGRAPGRAAQPRRGEQDRPPRTSTTGRAPTARSSSWRTSSPSRRRPMALLKAPRQDFPAAAQSNDVPAQPGGRPTWPASCTRPPASPRRTWAARVGPWTSSCRRWTTQGKTAGQRSARRTREFARGRLPARVLRHAAAPGQIHAQRGRARSRDQEGLGGLVPGGGARVLGRRGAEPGPAARAGGHPGGPVARTRGTPSPTSPWARRA